MIWETEYDEEEIREPNVEILEDDKHYTILVELPGVKKSNISLTWIDGNTIRVHAPPYLKTIKLKRPTKYEGAKAKYKNGVLTITLPIK